MSVKDKLTLIAENEQKVYEAGITKGKNLKEAEWWDIITKNNTRTDYYRAFSQCNFEYYRAPYTINTSMTDLSLSQTFYQNTALKKMESSAFDFSNKKITKGSATYGLYYTFGECSTLEEIEDIGIQPHYALGNTYINCKRLRKIEVIRVNEETTYTNGVFSNCQSLEEVRFEGIIGQSGLNFQWSKNLTYDSCHNIFSHLKDFRVPTIISTNVTNTQTPTVIGKGTLTAGKQYTWRYYMSQYPGWMVDDPTQNPISDPEKDLAFEETSITSIAKEITINGNTYIGFNAECRNFPGDTDGGYIIYVYQDGENIMVYPEIGITSIDTIELTLLIAEEIRTITMPKAVKDNGNASPEDIAEAEAKGWEITWVE